MNPCPSAAARRLLTALGTLIWLASCDKPGDAGGADVEGSVGGSGGVPTGGAGAPCVEDWECAGRDECSAAVCEAGTCVRRALARGTVCSAGYCNGLGGAAECVSCIDDAADAEPDSGCPLGSPVCNESVSPAFCVGCQEDSDCNDGLECTADRCMSSVCRNTPLPVGSECSDGVCDGQPRNSGCLPCLDDSSIGQDTGCTMEQPACDVTQAPAVCVSCTEAADCDDANECTSDSCEAGACEHNPVFAGTPCNGGYCNGIAGMESCVITQCQTDLDCDDGIACTAESCSSDQVCAYTPDDGQCPDSVDICSPNRCVVGTGCREVDASESLELLANGNLDADTADWDWMSVNYDRVIYSQDYIPELTAHTQPNVAWLGGGEAYPDEQNSLYQLVNVPAGSVSMELSFVYQVHAAELPDDQNQMLVTIRAIEPDQADREIVTFSNQDTSVEWTWTEFSRTIDDVEWAGSDVLLEFTGTGIDGYSHFFVDSISLVAKVCQ